MAITVDPEIQQQLKDQRLKQLAAYYYELQMNKVAFEANGKTEQAEEMAKLMSETETSYNAIQAM